MASAPNRGGARKIMGDNGARRASWLSNQPVQSKMLLAFGLVLAIFVIGTVAAVVSQDQSTRARQLSTASYEVIVDIDRLIRGVVDQQLSLRGYVITVNAQFLDAHDAGREELARQLEQLRARMQEDPLQLTRLAQVSALLDRYWEVAADPVLEWMEHTVTRPQAIAAVTSGQDGRYIDEMRRLLEEIQATEEDRLVRRTRAVEQ